MKGPRYRALVSFYGELVMNTIKMTITNYIHMVIKYIIYYIYGKQTYVKNNIL